MNDELFRHQLQTDAARDPVEFSPALHERIMRRVTSPRPVRSLDRAYHWRPIALAASLLLVAGAAIWLAWPRVEQPEKVALYVPLVVPHSTIEEGEPAAIESFDQRLVAQELASLDSDATRLANFVLTQIGDMVPMRHVTEDR